VGKGKKLSDFTYISNLIDALLSADEKLDTVAGGQAYFVTNGEPTSFFDFVAMMLAELKMPPLRGSVPESLVYSVAAVSELWDTLKGGTLHTEGTLSRFAVRYLCTHHYFNIGKARRDLGYAPKVNILEGVRLTVADLRASGAI
jgi:sterol-4alpha-carboxylate 3-dehydrogenase (decarboxylating)